MNKKLLVVLIFTIFFPYRGFSLSEIQTVQITEQITTILHKDYPKIEKLYQEIKQDKKCLYNLNSCSKYLNFKQLSFQTLHKLAKIADLLDGLLKNALEINESSIKIQPISNKSAKKLEDICHNAFEEYKQKYRIYRILLQRDKNHAKRIENQLYALEKQIYYCNIIRNRVQYFKISSFEIRPFYKLYEIVEKLQSKIRKYILDLHIPAYSKE